MGNAELTPTPGGPLTPHDIAEEYVHLALGLVRAPDPVTD